MQHLFCSSCTPTKTVVQEATNKQPACDIHPPPDPNPLHHTNKYSYTLTQAVEEDQLSKAWVALWGRQHHLDPSTKTWVEGAGDGNAAVRAAARRAIFLEAHPEQVRCYCCG